MTKVSSYELQALKRDAKAWRRLRDASWNLQALARRLVVLGAIAGGWAALFHVAGLIR